MNLTTTRADRIPLPQKLAYAAGVLANNLQAAAIPAMVVILNLGLKLDPVLVGIIGFAPRIVDALSDPIMGYISDNTVSRWGRRRPYMLVGAILSGILFAAMWQLPPGQSQEYYFRMFLGASIAYFLIYSLYSTPLIALGYEMTTDYHERTRLHALANTIGQLAWLTAPWFYAFMANEQWFADEAEGARVLAVWIGVALCVLGILPALFCREPQATIAEIESAEQKKHGFVNHAAAFFLDFKSTLQCRPFMKLCTATFLVFNGYQVGVSFTLYVLIYYVFHENKGSAGELHGWFGTLTSVCSLCAIPLLGWLATKFGKRETFLLAMSLSLVGYLMKWIGYNPAHPYWLLAACPFVACGIGSLFMLMASMVADVCDYDELASHQRREGVFGAIYWWMVKIGMAMAGFLSGVLLKLSGFDVELAAQTPRTLQLLRVFDVGVPMVTTLLAMGVMLGYEINEAKAREIRAELEQRQLRPMANS